MIAQQLDCLGTGPAGIRRSEGRRWLRLTCWLRGEHFWGPAYSKPYGRWARACRCCGREARA